MRRGAADSDGVIHLAFNHDFSQFQKNADNDREAIVAIGEVLLGSNRPFVITSGTAIAANVDGKPSTEDAPTASWNPRAGSEAAVKGLTADNLFMGQSPGFFDTLMELAEAADAARLGTNGRLEALRRAMDKLNRERLG